jgi:hypothetical protein
MRTAGAAAEALAFAPVYLLGGGARHGVDDGAGRGVDLVVPAEEALVVIGDLLLHRGDRGQLPSSTRRASSWVWSMTS